MAEPSSLSTLVQGLRKASSPWERLGMVTRGARALARLEPAKRRDLLRRIGLSAADDLVGHLASDAGPETREAIHRALERMEQDPETSAHLLRALADPGTRDATLGGLIAHLEEVVTETPEPASAAEESGDSPPEEAKEDEPEPTDPGPTEEAGRPGDEPPAGSRRSRGESVEAATGDSLVTLVDVDALMELDAPDDHAEAAGPDRPALPDRRTEALEQRLRELPRAWARRRLLDRELRGTLGEDLDRALDLVERFVEPKERSWCLTTLAASHPRSAADWDRLVEAADTDAVRRRLEMRRRRSASGRWPVTTPRDSDPSS